MGRCRRQFSLPEDFCRGLRSAGNWYGLWPRFHDAQVPNGQRVNVAYKHTSAGEMYGFWLRYFVYFLRVFGKSFRACRQGKFEVHL